MNCVIKVKWTTTKNDIQNIYLFVKYTFSGENVKWASFYMKVITQCLGPELFSSCFTIQIVILAGSQGVAGHHWVFSGALLCRSYIQMFKR